MVGKERTRGKPGRVSLAAHILSSKVHLDVGPVVSSLAGLALASRTSNLEPPLRRALGQPVSRVAARNLPAICQPRLNLASESPKRVGAGPPEVVALGQLDGSDVAACFGRPGAGRCGRGESVGRAVEYESMLAFKRSCR